MTDSRLLNNELMEALRTIIQLPQHIRSLDLCMRMNEAPTLTLTTLVLDAQGKHVIEGNDAKRETKTFHLVDASLTAASAEGVGGSKV